MLPTSCLPHNVSGFRDSASRTTVESIPLPSFFSLISVWLLQRSSYLPSSRHIPPKFITYVSSRIIFLK